MTVHLDGDRVEHVELRIFEPPRFFEAFLRGRSFHEAPDITARICGICPVAYQTCAVNALESLCGVQVPGSDPSAEAIVVLRRVDREPRAARLHAPCARLPRLSPGAVELARDAPAIVERGLALKRTGNEVMALVGGREIHPINVRVGGFYRAPSRRELRTLVDPLERAREAALETVRWTSGFEFPEREVECDLVALSHPVDYAIETRPCVFRCGARHLGSRVRGALRGAARRALDRLALAAARRRRHLSLWAARALLPELRAAVPRRTRGGAGGGPRQRRAAIRSAASSCAASSSSTPATRRCG